MVQKLLFNKIKTLLKTKYKLDMLSSEVRLAYVIYNVLMQEYHDIVNLRTVMRETYINYIDKEITFFAFERSIYRALENLCDKDNEKYIEKVLEIADEIVI